MGIRIRTDNYPHRETVIDDAADLWETNRTEAIVKSCEHATESVKARKDALQYLAGILPPDKLREVATRLSTRHMGFSVEIQVDGVTESSEIQPGLQFEPKRV